MPRRRSRFIQIREDRKTRRAPRGLDPGAAIRLTGLVVLVLIFVAVGAGFQGERFTSLMAGLAARLGPLAEPALFGASVLEILAVLAVVVVLGGPLWRRFKG